MNGDKTYTDDLLMAYLLDELPVDQRNEVDVWINESSENKQYFDDLKQIWQMSENSSPGDFDSVPAWKSVSHQITKRKLWQLPAFRIAASVVVLVGLLTIIFMLQDKQTLLETTTADNITTDTLPDGSVVTLNKNSSVLYASTFGTDNREIVLQGEAFFEVRSGQKLPFRVILPAGMVEVVGTKFNVRAYAIENEVAVSVEEGKVKYGTVNELQEVDQQVFLSAGEKAVHETESGKLKKSESTDVQTDNYWHTKKLVFDQMPLSEVVNVLNEVFSANIKLGNPELSNCFLTSSFEGDDLDHILEVIAGTFELEIKQENGYAVLYGKKCK